MKPKTAGTFHFPITQSAEGAKESSPDRKVGVDVEIKVSPGGRDTGVPLSPVAFAPARLGMTKGKEYRRDGPLIPPLMR